ncbi:MAG: hypothetical protein ACFFF4_18215 [Candidatus Thorarchaeota archaeon]
MADGQEVYDRPSTQVASLMRNISSLIFPDVVSFGQDAKDSFARCQNYYCYVRLGWVLRVKSLGTITACFPYVDAETRSVLQSFMDKAEGYDDFSESLCERVVTQESADLLVYFAYFHAYNQNMWKRVKNLIDAELGSNLTKLFELTYYARGSDSIQWSDFKQALSKALQMTKNDWMTCHVYITWREVVDNWFLEAAIDTELLDVLEERIENDKEFNFFLSSLHRMQAKRYITEGNLTEARKWFDSAIALTKIHDDLVKLVDVLLEKANMVKQLNFDEGMSILKIHQEISEQIGYPDALALNTHIFGHIAMAKGEIDRAIKCQKEYLISRESRGLPVGFLKCVVLALLYNQIGDGETAMSFVADGMSDILPSTVVYAKLQEAWALINRDQVEDASRSLDQARELSLKSNDEKALGLVYFTEGLADITLHEYPSAKYSLEKALEIFERTQSLAYTNMTLIRLVDVEIEVCAYDNKAKSSGPWMQKLMEHIVQRDMPGIRALTLLLEAKFRFKQGNLGDAKKLVKKALKISEKTDNPYIKHFAEKSLPELTIM